MPLPATSQGAYSCSVPPLFSMHTALRLGHQRGSVALPLDDRFVRVFYIVGIVYSHRLGRRLCRYGAPQLHMPGALWGRVSLSPASSVSSGNLHVPVEHSSLSLSISLSPSLSIRSDRFPDKAVPGKWAGRVGWMAEAGRRRHLRNKAAKNLVSCRRTGAGFRDTP